jgi:hypothetical protein
MRSGKEDGNMRLNLAQLRVHWQQLRFWRKVSVLRRGSEIARADPGMIQMAKAMEQQAHIILDGWRTTITLRHSREPRTYYTQL